MLKSGRACLREFDASRSDDHGYFPSDSVYPKPIGIEKPRRTQRRDRSNYGIQADSQRRPKLLQNFRKICVAKGVAL